MDPSRLQAKYNGSAKENVEIDGFHHSGKTWVSRPFLLFARQTAVHEILHTMSQPLKREATKNLYEGMTQYFAYEVAMKHLGWKRPSLADAYYEHYRFAVRLAEIVGEVKLREVFFKKGGGAIDVLRRAVDAKLGSGAFDRSWAALDKNQHAYAFAILGGEPRSDAPWLPAASRREKPLHRPPSSQVSLAGRALHQGHP